MTFSLQKISSTDFPFLKEVYRSTREKELALLNWTEPQKDKFIEFQFNAQHSYYLNKFPDIELYLIKNKSEKIGHLYIWRSTGEIRIIDIALLPKFQNRGIGSNILKQLTEESDKKDKKLTIHVEQQNPAIHLYERFGFKKISEEGIYFFMERQPLNKKAAT
jgi:ribosomal protein S18 acetylase RimI-like enzyme